MRESITLGSSPHDEPCAQLGTVGYSELAREECRVYADQLRRMYEAEHGRALPDGVTLRTKSNAHDFGVYYEVAVVFNASDEEAMAAAFWFDGNAPAKWDEIARQQLTKN